MPELSIVIVNYDTREPLRRCLESLRAHREGLDLEVIVVDNASRDGSAAMARAVMPDAVVVEPGSNTWFTGGNNLGIERAIGEYVFTLNPDTAVQPGTLRTMLAYLRARPGVGAVTCQMRYPDGRVQYTGSRVPEYPDLLLEHTLVGVLLRPWRSRRRAWRWFDGWHRDSTRPVEVVPGSNLMARRTVIRRIGGYDERFMLYFGEDDLCRRLLGAGYEAHFVAETWLTHEESASIRQVRRLATRIYFDDLLRYSGKYYGAPRTALLGVAIWPTRQAMALVHRLRGERT